MKPFIWAPPVTAARAPASRVPLAVPCFRDWASRVDQKYRTASLTFVFSCVGSNVMYWWGDDACELWFPQREKLSHFESAFLHHRSNPDLSLLLYCFFQPWRQPMSWCLFP